MGRTIEDVVSLFKRGVDTGLLDDIINSLCIEEHVDVHSFYSMMSHYLSEMMGVDDDSEFDDEDEDICEDILVDSMLLHELIGGAVLDKVDFKGFSLPSSWDVLDNALPQFSNPGNRGIGSREDVIGVLLALLGDEAFLENEVSSFYRGTTVPVVNLVLKIYTELFSSGYEVLKPYGLLTKEGCVRLEGDRVYVNDSPQLSGLYDIVSGYLRLSESDSRQFTPSTIINSSDNSSVYFPYKLLEFAFGRSSSRYYEMDKVYEPHSDSYSWDSYSKSVVRHEIQSIMDKSIIAMLRNKGFLSRGKYKSKEALSIVKMVLEKLKVGLSTCILVSNWDLNAEQAQVGFKIRVSTVHKGYLPSSRELVGSIIDKVFSGDKGDTNVIAPERTTCDGHVREYYHQFDSKLCNAEPLFAFKALDSLQARGIKPSWETLILGKDEDDSILTSKQGSSVNLYKNLVHYIISGSRAGKGVMTLNILASAVASEIPIFYLDAKPDMASLMKYISGGDMFVVNGGQYNAGDAGDVYNEFTPEKLVGWNKNIPDFLAEGLSKSKNVYTDFGDLFYYRALMFCLGIIYARVNLNGGELYEMLGGDRGIVVVVDEFTNFQRGLQNFLSPSGDGVTGISRNYCTPTALYNYDVALSEQALKPDKPIDPSKQITEFDIYCTEFINTYNKSLGLMHGLKNAGLKNKESSVSNIFILGQDIEQMPSESNTIVFNKTGRGISASEKGDYISNLFYQLDTDGFLGYNGAFPKYMNCTEGSKSFDKLTMSARYFAYVSKFDRDAIRSGNRDYANQAKYFKPFLILNDGDEESTYVNQLKQFCANNGLSWDDVKSRNADSSGALRSEVGFLAYIKQQSGLSDDGVRSVLSKSMTIGNEIVKRMGYTGNCIEFIMDLRPEWMFSVRDIFNALSSPSELSLTDRLPLYMKYFPLEGVSQEDDTYSDIDNYFQSYMDADMEYDDSSDISESDLDDSYHDILSDGMEEEDIKNKLNSTMRLRLNKLRAGIANTTTPQEKLSLVGDVINIGDARYKINKYSEPLNSDFIFKKSSDEQTAIENLRDLEKFVIEDISRLFGLERISNVSVVSEILVINGVSYEPVLGEESLRSLPLDLQYSLKSGQFAWAFDFGILQRMHNLTHLHFDDVNFIYRKVANDLALPHSITPRSFFNRLKNLKVLNIAGDDYTKDDSSPPSFEGARRSVEIMDRIQDFGWNCTKSSWNCLRSIATDKSKRPFWKAAGVVAMAGVTVGALGGTASTFAVKNVFKGISKGVKTIAEAIKDSM